MKTILLFLAGLLLSFPAAAQETENIQGEFLQDMSAWGDVRGFIWGVTPEDVKHFERVVLFDEIENTLFFIDEINGIKTLISYEFIDGKLWRVVMDMQKDDYPDPQEIVKDFVRFQVGLNKRYGEMTSTKLDWSNDYYKDKPDYWGLAVYNGHLKMRMDWQSGKTDVSMTLGAEDYDYDFKMTFTSRAIEKAVAEAKKEANRASSLLAPDRSVALVNAHFACKAVVAAGANGIVGFPIAVKITQPDHGFAKTVPGSGAVNACSGKAGGYVFRAYYGSHVACQNKGGAGIRRCSRCADNHIGIAVIVYVPDSGNGMAGQVGRV